MYRLYIALTGTLPFDPEWGLGGKLLFAREIGGAGSRLLTAGSVAGVASLGASASPGALRQAMRDGVIDFLVTSLEEALRILKNEVRKRQAISVGVSVALGVLAEQMQVRGVLPDLLPPGSWGALGTGLNLDQSEQDRPEQDQPEKFLNWGTRHVLEPVDGSEDFVTWLVDRRGAVWLPRLDSCAQAALPADDLIRRRWLRWSPRYLGRMAQRERGVAMSVAEVARFRGAVEAMLAERIVAGEEPVAVSIASGRPGLES